MIAASQKVWQDWILLNCDLIVILILLAEDNLRPPSLLCFVVCLFVCFSHSWPLALPFRSWIQLANFYEAPARNLGWSLVTVALTNSIFFAFLYVCKLSLLFIIDGFTPSKLSFIYSML